MAAAGETQDGSIRQNDRTAKTLLNDIESEESIKSAESLNCNEETPHPHSLDLDFMGEDHNSYKKNLKSLVVDTEVENSLSHLESSGSCEHEE